MVKIAGHTGSSGISRNLNVGWIDRFGKNCECNQVDGRINNLGFCWAHFGLWMYDERFMNLRELYIWLNKKNVGCSLVMGVQ